MNDLEKQQKAFQMFINRNQKKYKKTSNVSQEVILKYKNIAPKELITIWEDMGFGIYEDGFLQLVNPEEYDFVFTYIDKQLEPAFVIGITAMGDIILWEGSEGKSVASDEGNRCKIILLDESTGIASTNISYFLGLFISNEDAIKDPDFFNSKRYFDIKNKLPKLDYGQCYGYLPALALGGKEKIENLQIVDAKTYINIIGEAVGKIYTKN